MPAIFGNMFFLEGGLIFVSLGVLIYATKEDKRILSLGYVLFCFTYFIITTKPYIPIVLGKISSKGFYFFTEIIEYFLDTIVRLSPMSVGGSPLYQNYQWMMVFALPFFLMYNNKRGKSIKCFFYVFYPLHILLLYAVGRLV